MMAKVLPILKKCQNVTKKQEREGARIQSLHLFRCPEFPQVPGGR